MSVILNIYGKKRDISGEVIVVVESNGYTYFKDLKTGSSTQGYHSLKCPKNLFNKLKGENLLVDITTLITNPHSGKTYYGVKKVLK